MAVPVKKTAKKPAKKQRKIRTVAPVAVLDKSELERIMNCISMLINKENETPQTRININANARKLQIDLGGYRKALCEYFRLPE